MDLIVPVAVELITFQTDPSELLVVYFGPSRVDAIIDFGMDLSTARLSAAATKRRDRSSSNLLRAQKRFLIPPRSVTSPTYARTFLIGNVIS
jgi:hypothetical protein